MEKVKRNKRTEGITLVALVVTVVVLLILAGIALNLILGNNGILNKAVKSKRDIGEAETIEQLDFAVSSAFVTAKGDISQIKGSEINNEIKKYDENSTIYKSLYLSSKKNSDFTWKNDTIESDKNFYAYVNGKYYIQKSDTNEWEVIDSLMFDIALRGACNYYSSSNGENVDIIRFSCFAIPITDAGFEPLEYGLIRKPSPTCTDEEMKFNSYTGIGEYSIKNGIYAYGSSVKDIDNKIKILELGGASWATPGKHTGFSCRAYFTEENPETGEIRIKYSRIVSASASDFSVDK